MVAGGDEHLGPALAQLVAQHVQGVQIDAAAVEEVAGQQQEVAAVVAAEGAELAHQGALLLPALGGLLGPQGGEGGIQVQVCRVEEFNHGRTPFLRRCRDRNRYRW